ncbi:MAG: hypothetical protein JXQ75_10375 [Phycisphaerae bacterium]|nr:hypothetical protein [Phycisphaerae bacterium]
MPPLNPVDSASDHQRKPANGAQALVEDDRHLQDALLADLPLSGGRRSAILALPELVNIAEGRDAF